MEPKEKSIFRIILGIGFFILSVIWVANKISENQIISAYDWLITGVFALNGVVHFIEGLGFSVDSIFRRSSS